MLKHPLIQLELARQRRDLAQARSISKTGAAALHALRTQAQSEFILTLGPKPSWAPRLDGVVLDRVSPGH